MKSRESQLQAFDRLLTIMDDLRAQCPWDKKQTLQSLRHLTIEETYELSDAILKADGAKLVRTATVGPKGRRSTTAGPPWRPSRQPTAGRSSLMARA